MIRASSLYSCWAAVTDFLFGLSERLCVFSGGPTSQHCGGASKIPGTETPGQQGPWIPESTTLGEYTVPRQYAF